jgi:hypothetical protein
VRVLLLAFGVSLVLAAPAGAVGPPMSMGSVVGKATRDAASRCRRHVARLPEQYRLIAECESPAAACTLSRQPALRGLCAGLPHHRDSSPRAAGLLLHAERDVPQQLPSRAPAALWPSSALAVLAGSADGMKPIVRALLRANDELNEEEATVGGPSEAAVRVAQDRSHESVRTSSSVGATKMRSSRP